LVERRLVAGQSRHAASTTYVLRQSWGWVHVRPRGGVSTVNLRRQRHRVSGVLVLVARGSSWFARVSLPLQWVVGAVVGVGSVVVELTVDASILWRQA